ncbi:hypothetical protein QE152_g13252 [Popillia japonica]|uniref:Uncharacterized protein n=1 Tax=Popillia japonica TaxID=7064 RepID=A0AAW1LDY6_POPJA
MLSKYKSKNNSSSFLFPCQERKEKNVKCYLDLDSSTKNEVQNEQLDATSETSPVQESVDGESGVSSEDVEEAFVSREKVTSSGRVTKPPQRLDL